MAERITISGEAIEQAFDLALAPDREEAVRLLSGWVKQAAIATHPEGNRRYGDFILRVACNQLQSVFLDTPDQSYCGDCFGTGHVKVFDVEIGARNIPCQDCTTQEIKGVENERHDAIPTWQTQS